MKRTQFLPVTVMALFAFILCSGSHTPSSGSSIDGDLDKTISDLTAQITKIKYQLTNFTKRRTRANQRVKLSFHKDIKQLSKTREELLTKINALQVNHDNDDDQKVDYAPGLRNKTKTSKSALVKDLKGIIATFAWYEREAQQNLKDTSLEYLSEMPGFGNDGVEVTNASDHCSADDHPAELNGFYHRGTMNEEPPQEFLDHAVAAGANADTFRMRWREIMREGEGRSYYWKPAGQSGVPCIIYWKAPGPSAIWVGWGCTNLPMNERFITYTATPQDHDSFQDLIPPAGEWVNRENGETLTLNVME